jgi:hypothetical protein
MRRRPPSPEAVLAIALCAAGLALAAPARARDDGAPAAGGALRVTADPPRLVLGKDGAAELRVAAAPDVEDVALSASAGRIEGVKRLPGGGFVARYRPPADRIPQVAIVAVLGRTAHGSEDGWLAIPLSGQGAARVKAAPGTEITLQIGDRRFGPRRAGADGVVVIPIVVPPGVREAHHGFTPIDLHVPETQLLHAVLDRAIVLADRTERVRVLAYVVAPHGAARRGDVPVFEPTRGTVAVTEREPGAFEAIWTVPPGRAGEERLSVRLGTSAASRAALRLETVSGPPAIVAVSFDREALDVEAGRGALVTARALDAAGNLVPAALALSTDAGRLEGVREREPGEVEAQLVAGPSIGARRELRVTAAAPGVGISGSRVLPLRPGPPAAVAFARDEDVVRADGKRELRLAVAVADRHGNPVDVAPAVTAARGRIVAVEETGVPGAYDVRYLAPAVAGPTPDRLVAVAGPARASATRLLLPPEARLRLAPSLGLAVDVRGRGSGPVATIAAEVPADLAVALRHGLAASWRAEVGTLDLGDLGATILGGASLARAVGGTAVLRASLAAGAVVTNGSLGAAGRVAIEAGRARGTFAPFAEVSLLAASAGAPGAFAAVAIAAGLRFGVER